MIQCNCCGKLTKNSKFCCRSCSISYANKHNPKRKRIPRSPCVLCGTSVHDRNAKRCKRCIKIEKEKRIQTKENWGKMTLGELRKNSNSHKHSPSYAHAWVRNHCAYLHDKKNQKCQICDYDKYVERCHIKPISKFDESTTLEEINDIKNIAFLCPNHHWELDHGYLSLVTQRASSTRGIV